VTDTVVPLHPPANGEDVMHVHHDPEAAADVGRLVVEALLRLLKDGRPTLCSVNYLSIFGISLTIDKGSPLRALITSCILGMSVSGEHRGGAPVRNKSSERPRGAEHPAKTRKRLGQISRRASDAR
jgi:hypothetical protein